MGILPLALTTLLLAPDAQAGGVGLMGMAGTHQVRAYYYRDDGLQGVDTQSRPNFGIGGEALLGDKDDRVMGMMRLYVMTDTPPGEPDLSNESADFEYTYPAAHEQGNSDIGTLQVGVQWGVFGDPAGTQAVLTSLIGSGFATKDNLEFFIGELGAGVTHNLNDRLQATGNLSLTTRYRKRIYMGASAYAGVRYLFD